MKAHIEKEAIRKGKTGVLTDIYSKNFVRQCTMADSGSPGTNMPWDTVDLVDACGEPIENTARDAILAIVEQALANPDVDPDVLLEIASRVSAQIGSG